MFKHLLSFLLVLGLMSFWACETTSDPKDENSDIPADPTTVTVPPVTEQTIATSSSFSKTGGNASRIRLNFGVVNSTNGNPVDLYADYSGGNHNFYLQEDSKVKGVKLTKASAGTELLADIVFTVDNSGSMGGEADSVAAKIVDFANALIASGLNAQFGCVGYSGRVYGAINLTDETSLNDYLTNRLYFGSPVSGTSRTVGFAGSESDSTRLDSTAANYAYGVWGENGVVGVLFADTMFTWRSGAQRVFINFTDEPTQPGGYFEWGTENFCTKMAGVATVHTVWSGGDTTGFFESPLSREKPWAMSECTNGTIKLINYNASDLDLTDLLVTGALENSYLIEYLTSAPSDTHTVVVTVKTNDAEGEITFDNITYK
jgi:von Willebrand factor type A domain-containing protein